ncbi:MAG: phosphoenolpyruvate synthase [Patescibacteria group bacterium]|nr:phosphoenolpyruvate synthase [Patescibacteria group bacterium]
MSAQNKLIVKFNEVDKHDVGLVGGKGANLGEMTLAKFPIPQGFIVTANSYFEFIKQNKLADKIKNILQTVDVDKPDQLNSASLKIKKLIIEGDIPENITTGIIANYLALGAQLKDVLVAVRSSATAEDLPSASFAGQQETYLNVRGESNVVNKVRECWASLFTPRAIYYREKNHFSHFKVGLAAVVQRMVESECSGVMFTIDPLTNDKNKIVVEAILGLGELIVQGAVTPDHFEIDKKTLKITHKIIGRQEKKMVKAGTNNKILGISKGRQSRQKLNNKVIEKIAAIGKNIEKHYFFPQDIEWAYQNGKIYIVQSRPVTTIKETGKVNAEENKKEAITLKQVLQGQPASPGIGVGPAKIIYSAKEIGKIKNGDILVTVMTNPDFVPAMKKASAIVTNEGGRTAHAAIVSRELGIPAVVGTTTATKTLKNNRVYTVDGAKGLIYEGAAKIKSKTVSLTAHQPELEANPLKTATKIYVNLAEPEFAQKIAAKNVDGVGLLRAEFMIAQIGTHPKKFIEEHKGHVFTAELEKGLKEIASAFYPRPVIYRTTDFKTNEYRDLKGGKAFEPVEPNPLLGFRGAYRYISNSDVFKLELEAIKNIREKHHLTNLNIMIPFVRTVKELIDVRSLLSQANLKRSHNFKLWMMVEIPSNVILLPKFIEAGIDGVSIGSNDLTMLILGTDRDNAEVASEYDERNEAVQWALERTVKICRENHITSSICGQAPSDYPDLTQKLVEWGITSVSVNPDRIEDTRTLIYETEGSLLKKNDKK